MATKRVVEEDEIVDKSVVVATFDTVEFRAVKGDPATSKLAWQGILNSLRAYRHQREELMKVTPRPYQVAMARNHVEACNILVAALKADEIRKADGSGLFIPLRRTTGKKQTGAVLCEAPWDLMAYIAKYADDRWQQTSDVKFPDGPPPPNDRPGTGRVAGAEVEATDAVTEDEFEVSGDDGDGAETTDNFGSE